MEYEGSQEPLPAYRLTVEAWIGICVAEVLAELSGT
jgi:pyrroloquinoline quinone (PQQ) biosynthesis protein C